jgi:alpha-1,6-mannosyltransferase
VDGRDYFQPAAVTAPESGDMVGAVALRGAAGTLLMAVAGLHPGVPFTLPTAGGWFIPHVPLAGWLEPFGSLLALVAFFSGMFLLATAWLRLCRAVRGQVLAPKKVLVIFGLWALPLVLAPPLFSRDVYIYAAQGEMVTQGLSPYRMGADHLGTDPYVEHVDRVWRSTRSPYGPLFTALVFASVKVTAHHPVATVLLLRLLALAGLGLVAACLPALATSLGHDPAEALVLGLLNPVVLLHLVAGGHNDALMMGLLVAGVLCGQRGRPIAALVLCTLSASVKIPGAAGVAYVGGEPAARAGRHRRLRLLLVNALAAAGLLAAFTAALGLGWGWVGALSVPAKVRMATTPTTMLSMILGPLLRLVGVSVSPLRVLALCRLAGLVLAGVIAILLWRRAAEIGSVQALGLTMLAVALLGPTLQPWYLTWGLILLAASAPSLLSGPWLVACAALNFLILPGGSGVLEVLGRASPGAGLASVATLATVAVCIGALILVHGKSLSGGPGLSPDKSLAGGEG